MDLPRIKAVKQSWKLVEKDLQGAGVLFFSNIFRGNPELLDLFSFRDYKGSLEKSPAFLRHSLGVMRAVGLVVGNLEDLDSVIPVLKALGRSHKEFGVLTGMFATIGGHLINTLKSALGAAWTPEVEEAWITAYGTVSAVMKNPDEIMAFSMRWWDYTVLVASLGWAWMVLFHLAGFRALGGRLDGAWVSGLDCAFGLVFLLDLLAPRIHLAVNRPRESKATRAQRTRSGRTLQPDGSPVPSFALRNPFTRAFMVPLRKVQFNLNRSILKLRLDTLDREPLTSSLCLLSFPLTNIDRVWMLVRSAVHALSRFEVVSGLIIYVNGLLGHVSDEQFASSVCAIGGPRWGATGCASEIFLGHRYPSGQSTGMTLFSLFVLLRLCTLPRALRLSNSLKNLILVKTHYWSGAALRLIQLIVMMVFACHAFGCWWFIVSRWEGATSDEAWTVAPGLMHTNSSYLLAIHRGFVEASGIGNSESPSTGLEAVSSLVMHIVGAALFTMIVGNTVTFMETSTRVEDIVSQDVHHLKEFMLAAGVPDHSRRTLVDGLVGRAVFNEKDQKALDAQVSSIAASSEMLWSNHDVDTTMMSQMPQCVSKLPQYMQADLLLHLRIRAMRMLHTFQKLSEPALNIAARSMDRKLILHAGDYLFRQGEPMPNLVFYIQSGELELTTEGQTLVTVRSGTVIGEEVIAHVLMHAERMGRGTAIDPLYAAHSVRAITTTEVLAGCGVNTLLDLWDVHQKDAKQLLTSATRKKNLLSSLSSRALSYRGSSVEWRMNWNNEVSKSLNHDNRSMSSGSSSGAGGGSSSSTAHPPAHPGLAKAKSFSSR